MSCDTLDFMYPLLADVYHPIVDQNVYGQIKKQWVYDRSIAVSFAPAGSAMDEDLKAKTFVKLENMLVGRARCDIRISKNGENNSLSNVLITNIRNKSNELVYLETSGERTGRGTIYEIATQDPFIDPFGDTSYYKLVIRRTENQGVENW